MGVKLNKTRTVPNKKNLVRHESKAMIMKSKTATEGDME
jgi:hypothetical protein